MQFLVGLLIAFFIGFEAVAEHRRWTLARRGWTTLGFVVGEDTRLPNSASFRMDQTRDVTITTAKFARTRVYRAGEARGPIAIRCDRFVS